jgi:predicted thioesterase
MQITNHELAEEYCVDQASCISDINHTLPDILGSYIIMKWMEATCAKNIARYLDNDFMTVGKEFCIDHVGMAKKGDDVKIISSIIELEKRSILFCVEAIGSSGKIIATATHKRSIIPKKLIPKLLSQ